MPDKFMIFTDLDGTLLDHSTYSFKAAQPALEFLKSANIPLILCTSKTRAEIEYYRELLNNNCPFISENGGAIFIPQDYFKHDFKYDKSCKSYLIIEFGTEREVLIDVLESVSNMTGAAIKGFSQMDVLEVAELTGLEPELANLASERDYSEPFLISGDEKDYESIERAINLKGHRYTRGGRFHHILGNNDKGKAVKTLSRLYSDEYGEPLKTIALGDSLNDLPMLEQVDIPIMVQKPNGEYDGNIKRRSLIFADGQGPVGWNAEILKLFMSFDSEVPENTGN